MKTEKNILIAFLLNFFFSVFEFVGGTVTGSVAIVSDALHDLGDSLSIGISYFLEKKSRKRPDESHTYGYLRYSVMGSVITTVILLVGSVLVIYNSVLRIITPREINYNGMIIFAVIGTLVNLIAARVTHGGESLNEKAVNLHMLEDVLGWIAVLIGAVLMKFTDFGVIDPLLSIGVAVFILINAIGNLREILDIFLEKTPKGINVDEIKHALLEIEGVKDAHHIHIRTIDGNRNIATLHIVAEGDFLEVKRSVKDRLSHMGISHTTVEIEAIGEECCDEVCCGIDLSEHSHHHGHHHHH